jgi:tetratricopeptide (TPR) repeat protein
MSQQPEPDVLPSALEAEVKNLLKKGEHAAAAAALWHAGHPRRAGAIYEQIFEHKKALNAYEAGGDVVGATRMALELADTASLERLVTLAIAQGQGDVLLQALSRAGRDAEVARVHLARGDALLAAQSFERAGMLDKAAQCLEEAGQVRESGLLLERHLELHPDDAEASLRLGRILASFGRHDDGIALLQRAIANAIDPDATLARAASTLMVSFVQLGYEQAARAVLMRWQAAWKRLQKQERTAPIEAAEAPPESFDAFLASERAAALAAIQTARSGGGTQPPRPAEGARHGTGHDDDKASDLDDLFGAEPTEERKAQKDPSSQSSQLAADDTLLLAGRYLLGEPLGGGGVGQVFRAYDAFADRPVAVKIFGAQVLSSEAVQSFARDARAFAGLGHPAVAALVELNMAQGFVVTELVNAPTVEERMRQGGDGGWLLPAARALLDLLGNCHRMGLVHGGLKPTNVFLMPAGVRVVDVGAHRLLALRSTETGGLSSVWPYLSPEQLFGAQASSTGDLYAVGAILYRALTGKPPFARAEDDRRQAPPRASSVNANVPPAWDDFLAKALHPDPAQRFADAAEMDAALPAVAPGLVLPPAASLGGETQTQNVHQATSRYARGALVRRDREGKVRIYEGTDLVLERPVWLIDADDFAMLRPLVVSARLWRGVQPIYDVIPDANRVVVARDRAGQVVDLAALRRVPQSLTRDLAGVARALEWLHGEGFAAGGFTLERALGPVGPRLTLAPASLFVDATPERVAADWESFEALVDTAFDLQPDPTLDGRGRVLQMLHDKRLLDRQDLEALGAEAQSLTRWAAFLEATTLRLVQGASARVVARLVANVVRG